MSQKSDASNARPDRSKRSELMQYYDSARKPIGIANPALDLNNTEFDAKLYSDKMIKVSSIVYSLKALLNMKICPMITSLLLFHTQCFYIKLSSSIFGRCLNLKLIDYIKLC
jgi:hypothetical protein